MTTATIFIYTCVVAVFGVGVIVALGGWGAALLDLAVRKTLDLDGWDKEEEEEETHHKEEDIETSDIETLDIDDAEATLVSTDKIPLHHPHPHTAPHTTPHPTPHLIFNLKAPK